MREAGLQKAEAVPWFGIAAPAGVPAEIVARLAAAVGQALAMPDVAQAMAPMGMAPRFEAGEAFADRIRRERAMYGDLVRRIGARRG